jgi:uncharacterized phage protein gp47/JayE
MALELTPDGLSTQTQAELVADLASRLRAAFGNNLNTSADSIMGQLVNIESELDALNQQVLLAVYRSFDPNSATGVALDARAALTGSIRKGATSSVVNGTLTFSGAGTMVDGDLIQNDDNTTQWELTNGPHTGPGAFAAVFAAVDTGPILANAGTTWSLITGVPGLDSFANPTDDATLGRNQEADPDFRIRRQEELFAQNIGGLAAIRGNVSQVEGVTTARVYHNPLGPGDDADGIPFKAFNVVVETDPTPPSSDLQQDIADAIFASMGAGGQAYGTDFTKTVADVEGTSHSVSFDIITTKDVFVAITLDTTGTEEIISPNLADVVAAEVLEVATSDFTGIGKDVLEYRIKGIVSDLAASGEITGVVTVTVELSEVALVGPFIDPVPIGIRQRADFDSVNIGVTVV